MPLFALLCIIVFVTSGPPIFYRGERLGLHRKPFTIYKFRSLKLGANAISHDRVLPEGSRMETLVGKLLRESRLDELPQLLNVLKGDMNMFGPRPVRRALADRLSKKISEYDQRFRVKPGLIGQAQIFLPHGAPKKLRARYNAILIRRKVCIWKEVITIIVVTWTMFAKIYKYIRAKANQKVILGNETNLRLMPRHKPSEAIVVISDDNGQTSAYGNILDINNEAFAFVSKYFPDPANETFTLKVRSTISGRRKRALCRGMIERQTKYTGPTELINGRKSNGSSYRVVVKYQPVSALDSHIIDKYFLEKCFIPS